MTNYYGKTLRLMNPLTSIYVGDQQNGAVRALTDSKVGTSGYISGWDSSYERATLFTQDEAFALATKHPELAIVGLHPGIR